MPNNYDWYWDRNNFENITLGKLVEILGEDTKISTLGIVANDAMKEICNSLSGCVDIMSLIEILKIVFPDAKIELKEEDNKITGTIRWVNFKGLSVHDRGRIFSTCVLCPLAHNSATVGSIYLLTPKERLC